MLSLRIKYAMAHLSRKQHTRLLARPNWRRLRRVDMNIMVDPNAISRAALTCKASKRIKIMARPKYVTKKYDVQRDYPPPYQRIHPRTLAARSTSRIRILAMPKKRAVEYRVSEPPRPPPRDHDWKRHREIIDKLAKPKVVHKPKHVPKKRWRPVRMRRIQRLAIPVSREIPLTRDPFSVTRSALRYRMTERMRQLVYRKTELEVITPRKPGVVSRAALKATASTAAKSRIFFLTGLRYEPRRPGFLGTRHVGQPSFSLGSSEPKDWPKRFSSGEKTILLTQVLPVRRSTVELVPFFLDTKTRTLPNYPEDVNPGEARGTSRWNGNGSQGGRLHRLPGCFESEMLETIEKARKAEELQAYEIMIASYSVALV
ncbi:hypothetical protein HZH68_010787 [Vespula germanica]|uniref:Testicular haploid expressed gene protein-like n=1 Tax=Vespula germanica TaxID=30212 RepID=A0A834JSJ1_VESGE|nr:hypothetical protein HZH68_010787 [Vespula germanica]